MKNKINELKKQLINIFNKYSKDPKLMLEDIKKITKTYISNNQLYVVFVVFSLLNAFLLQLFTVGYKTFFFKPMFITLFLILLLGSFHFMFKEENKKKYLFVIFTLFIIISMSNTMYYNWYKSFATISILSNGKFIGDMGGALDEQVFQLKDLIFVGLYILYIYIIRTKNLKKDKKANANKTKNHFAFAIVLLMLILPHLTSLEKARLVSQWNREYVVAHFGIYAYQTADIVKSVEPTISGLFGYDKALKKFYEYYDEVPTKREYTNEYSNVFEGKNIIGIHAESIQTFLIDLEINGKEVTPNLNKLAKNSIYFDNFYAQVSVGTSSDTEFTLNTSLMPTTIGTVFTSYNTRTFNSMPNILKEKGYDTYSMHGNKKMFWDRAKMYPQLGYDTFYSKDDFIIDEEIGLGLSDKSFFRQSMDYILEMHKKDNPFYTTMIMLTHHTPFADSELFDEFDVTMTIYDEELEEDVVMPYLEGTKLGRYIKSAHYADQALGQFLQDLEDNNILDDTVIVLYGDHDARLASKDYRRMYNYDPYTDTVIKEADEDERYVPYTYYDHEINRKVPLMIYTKDKGAKYKRKISTPMGMIDVMPTLGNMFNFYNKYQLGNDIFELDDNMVIFANGNFLTSKMYYNSQKSEYFVYNEENIITEEYIQDHQERSELILSLSSDLIIYDLIKRDIEDSMQVNEQAKERMTPY